MTGLGGVNTPMTGHWSVIDTSLTSCRGVNTLMNSHGGVDTLMTGHGGVDSLMTSHGGVDTSMTGSMTGHGSVDTSMTLVHQGGGTSMTCKSLMTQDIGTLRGCWLGVPRHSSSIALQYVVQILQPSHGKFRPTSQVQEFYMCLLLHCIGL
jgi:hypothetical protein